VPVYVITEWQWTGGFNPALLRDFVRVVYLYKTAWCVYIDGIHPGLAGMIE
jgi:hypothetical protein